MSSREKVNILLVDDQPAKLLSYEVILGGLNENLIKANSAREALECLLRNEIAVVLIDVVMPELDGFELARMIHDHPRFQRTAIIFISAVQVNDVDHMRGYEVGAVDYVPVPVIPAVLRAKVGIFVDLYRKTTELQRLNQELERRVEERTSELQAFSRRLQDSERRRSLALAASRMGSWDWDLLSGKCTWDEGQYRIFGVVPSEPVETFDSFLQRIHGEDLGALHHSLEQARSAGYSSLSEFRVIRPDGDTRWCMGAAVTTIDANGQPIHISGVTADITERKEAEQRQALLAREVDHRSRNALAVVQSILRLSRAERPEELVDAVTGRIQALATVHTLLSESRWEGADLGRLIDEEFTPYRSAPDRLAAAGPSVSLGSASAQAMALAIHELATNAAKYGALSGPAGQVKIVWSFDEEQLRLEWTESGGPRTQAPRRRGFGLTMIEANIESSLGGTMQIDWLPEGLRCVVAIPRRNLTQQPRRDSRAAPVASRRASNAPADANIKRVLVVEDEVLVALILKDLLQGLGYEVVGPVNRNRPAMAAIESERLDAAVLDLNIAGEPVYPVAEMLRARGVPFAFLTGYDPRSLDSGFSKVPVLQKPVEPEQLRRTIQSLLADGATEQPAPLRASVG